MIFHHMPLFQYFAPEGLILCPTLVPFQEISSRSIMHFLLAVPRPLGNLQYIRIWHDNSGEGSMASWFLHKVVIEDLQTDRR